jgi:hypothetical protein
MKQNEAFLYIIYIMGIDFSLFENPDLEKNMCEDCNLFALYGLGQTGKNTMSCFCKIPKSHNILAPKKIIKSYVKKIIKNAGINIANISIRISSYSELILDSI